MKKIRRQKVNPADSAKLNSRGPVQDDTLRSVDPQSKVFNKCLKGLLTSELIASRNGTLGLISDMNRNRLRVDPRNFINETSHRGHERRVKIRSAKCRWIGTRLHGFTSKEVTS